MADEITGISEDIAIESKPEVKVFKEQVAKADGAPIPLRKKTVDGKRLYITTRYIQNPVEEQVQHLTVLGETSNNVNRRFWGWKDDSLPKTGVMLVDVYAKEGKKVVPLGHMDWWLDNDYANGGGNMHGAANPQSEHEKLAGKQWDDHYEQAAFKVDSRYHNQGLGSLMIAASAIVLPANGVRRFYTGAILEPAQKTYARFNIRYSDFTGEGGDRALPIERLSKHPQVNKTIADFV